MYRKVHLYFLRFGANSRQVGVAGPMTPVSFARKAEIKLGRQTEVFSRAFVARRGKIAETRDQVSIQGCVGLNASGGLAGSRNHRGEDGEPGSEKKGEGDKRGREWEGEVRETHESDHPRPWNVSRHRVVNPPGFSLSLFPRSSSFLLPITPFLLRLPLFFGVVAGRSTLRWCVPSTCHCIRSFAPAGGTAGSLDSFV